MPSAKSRRSSDQWSWGTALEILRLPDGKMAGKTLASQTEQAYKNILAILKEVGATQENVVKQTIYMVKGQDIKEGYAATQKAWGNYPTAISAVFVESLGVPGALVEIEATAVVNK